MRCKVVKQKRAGFRKTTERALEKAPEPFSCGCALQKSVRAAHRSKSTNVTKTTNAANESAWPAVGGDGQGPRAAKTVSVALRFRTIAVALGGDKPRRKAAVECAAANHPPSSRCGSGRLDLRFLLVAAVPITRPLPAVADDVEKTERRCAVRKSTHGRGALPSVVRRVERPHRLTVFGAPSNAFGAARVEARRVRLLVSPGIFAAVGSARGKLPLGLGGEPLLRVRAIADRAIEIDTVDRVVAALGAAGVAERAVDLDLAWRDSLPVDFDRGALALAGVRAGFVLRRRDLVTIHAERGERHLVGRLLVGVAVIGPHEELASGDLHHVGRTSLGRRRRRWNRRAGGGR